VHAGGEVERDGCRAQSRSHDADAREGRSRNRAHDFLISPTSPITAYAAEEATPGNDPQRPFEHIAFTAPFNMSEQPAASICAGYDADGLPIGLQIVGHRFDDLGVLRMASAYETLRPPQRTWPEEPS
jgi:aspartyl-tRNA(Asn)/glutamyl-tRNA(Gln) amidotransferase subunit A